MPRMELRGAQRPSLYPSLTSMRRPISSRLLGQPQSETADKLKRKSSMRLAIFCKSFASNRLRLDSSAKKLRPVLRIIARKTDFGSQCTRGSKRMKLNRKPAIRRCHEYPLFCDTAAFLDEPKLVFGRADVFKHGGRMDNVECGISKR